MAVKKHYMDDKFKIRLKIDNKEYPLTILRSEEEFYRNAARRIDKALNYYRSTYPKFEAEIHWAMTALDFAYENEQLKVRNDTEPFYERIEQMMRSMDRVLKPEEKKEDDV